MSTNRKYKGLDYYDRKEVIQRLCIVYNWTCQICLNPNVPVDDTDRVIVGISKTGGYNYTLGPHYPTIDHINGRKAGHTKENLRLAHNVCNLVVAKYEEWTYEHYLRYSHTIRRAMAKHRDLSTTQ